MRASIVIAAHNEGESLWKTVASIVESSVGLDYEIIVADNASDDGSVEEMLRRFPRVRVVRHQQRRGASPTKDLGARDARGEVFVFLDGHTNPQPGAILQLVDDVERLEGRAVVTPTVEALDVGRWRNTPSQVGHELYEDLRGFDPHMRFWGVEDLDFGLKCWLMGFSILHDPEAVIGHRFRQSFDNYDVPIEHLLVNQLRMARKGFTHSVWSEWADRCRARHAGRLTDHPEGLWARVWSLFEADRPSVEQQRAYLHARRVRDEFWYAERFGLTWPRLESAPRAPVEMAFEAMAAEGSPSPSPPPVTVDLDIEGVPDDKEVTVGGLVVRRHDGNDAPRKKITLDSTATAGNVTLTRNNTKVKVFDAASDGTEITFNGTDNKFPVSDLPKSLYVQGDTASSEMRDVTLTLTHDESGASDSVKFTVLWVTLSTKHTGSVADDNSAKTFYNSVMVPPSSSLGHHLRVRDERFKNEGGILIRGSEFIGSVNPNNLVPADFGGSMRLEREKVAVEDNVAGRAFWGPPPNGNQNSEDKLAGDDFEDGPSPWRDDDPQSGGSAGKIYDLDAPGMDALWTQTQNMIQRFRDKFKFWATYDGTRCSVKKEWYTRQSYKLTGSTDSGTAESAEPNTLTDTDKEWAANTWVPGVIRIKAGTGAPQFRRITANTATKITVASNWDPPLDGTSEYWVINNTTWVQWNDIPNDNENADGSTNITWNLE